MVRLFRGARGRGVGRPPLMGPRLGHARPNFQMPHVRPMMRGRLLRGHPAQPRLPRPPLGLGLPSGLPPRVAGQLPPRPPPLGLPPRHLPPGAVRLPPRPMHFPPPRPGFPPPLTARPMLHGPPIPRPRPGFPILPGPPLRGMLRGRGRILRGVGLKRLGSTANGKAKKAQKRKEKTEEQELKEPWVTEALKVEIKKKYELQSVAKEKMTDGDWQAFKDQRSLVSKMMSAAKLEYIGSHPEPDVDKIMSEVAAAKA